MTFKSRKGFFSETMRSKVAAEEDEEDADRRRR